MGTNALTASFGLDLAPLKRDFAQAEQIGKAGATRVQSALKNATAATGGGFTPRTATVNWAMIQAQQAHARAFTNPPGPRTAASFRPARPGQYTSPAEQMMQEATRSSRSLAGFGRGFTVLAAVHQLAAAYKTASTNAAELRAVTDKLMRPISGASSISQLQEQLKGIAEVREQLAKRSVIEGQGILGKGLKFGRQLVGMSLGEGSPGEQDAQAARNQEMLRKRASEDISLMAKRQGELNRAERESVSGSERKAEILKAQSRNVDNLRELAEAEAAAGVNNPAARNAEMKRYEAEVRAIDKRFDALQRAQAAEARIGELSAGNLTIDQQRLQVLKNRVDLLARESGIGSKEQRAQKRIELGQAETDLARGEFEESNKTSAQKRVERKAQRKYQQFLKNRKRTGGLTNVHRDMSGNVIGGTRAATGEREAVTPPDEFAEAFGSTSANPRRQTALDKAYKTHPDAYELAGQSGMLGKGGFESFFGGPPKPQAHWSAGGAGIDAVNRVKGEKEAQQRAEKSQDTALLQDIAGTNRGLHDTWKEKGEGED